MTNNLLLIVRHPLRKLKEGYDTNGAGDKIRTCTPLENI